MKSMFPTGLLVIMANEMVAEVDIEIGKVVRTLALTFDRRRYVTISKSTGDLISTDLCGYQRYTSFTPRWA